MQIDQPVDDTDRLAALASFAVLDTPGEPGFDDAVRLAARLCGAPIALVSLVAADRQWFKARLGFPLCETDLDRSVCKFALSEPDLLVIPDLADDPRTRVNPLVTGEPHIRFYAGAPLRVSSGEVLGSLCVIDTVPRPEGLTPEQTEDLRSLGRQVTSLLDLRRVSADERVLRKRAVADAARMEAMIAAQQAIASASADLDGIFAAVVEGALRMMEAASGAVIELREGDELVYRAASGTSAAHLGTRLPLHGTLSGRSFCETRPLHCADVQREPGLDQALARRLGIRAMVVVPVFRRGVAIGVLKVQSDRPSSFGSRDVLVTQMLAGLVASGFGEVAEVQTRQALRNAEDRYKAIFDSAIDFAIIAADPDERITDWNTGAERILGWQATDARGKPLDVFFTPEDRAAGVPEQEERGALAAGSSSDERWHLRADGRRFWAVGRMMTLRHERGEVQGYLKILQDRTRERRRQQRLDVIARASEALLSPGDPGVNLRPILVDGAEALGFDQSYIWDIEGAELRLVLAIGIDEAARAALSRVGFDVPLCGLVAASGEPLVLARLQSTTEPRYAIAREDGVDAYAGYPIFSRGRMVGTISFAARSESAFDEETLDVFATIVRFLAIARERRDAAAALRTGEERLRLAQQAGRIGTFEIDGPTSTINVSAEFCRLFGLAPAPSYPVAAVEALVIPADTLTRSNERSRDDGSADPNVEYRIHRADDGRLRWIARRSEFIRDGGGRVVGMVGTVQDVTERRDRQAQQAALIALGDRLRVAASEAEVAEAAGEVLGATLNLTRAGYASVDLAAQRFRIEREWTAPGATSLVGEHDASAFRASFAEVEGGFTLSVANIPASPMMRADAAGYEALGTRAQIKVPVLESDRLVGVLYAHQDEPRTWSKDEVDFANGVADRIHAALARVRAEAEQRVLNLELSHRMKNSFAMVQAIAGQTLRGAENKAAVDAFVQRLHALAGAHDVLLQQSWSAAVIGEVVANVLRVVADPRRFDVSGPDINIGPRATLSLSLLLHELATNAAKYGSLGVEEGRVVLAWLVAGAGRERTLVLDWSERDGPPAREPERKGFGSRLIRMGLIGSGGAELRYTSEGLRASFTAPLDRVQSA